MKYLSIVIILLTYGYLEAQDSIRPPSIEGISDYKYHVPVDTSMSQDLRLNRGHLQNPIDRIFRGDTMFTIYNGQHLFAEFLVEAVDLTQGSLLWKHTIGWRTDGYSATPKNMKLISGNQLEILAERGLDHRVMVDRYVLDCDTGMRQNRNFSEDINTEHDVRGRRMERTGDSTYVVVNFSRKSINLDFYSDEQRLLRKETIPTHGENGRYGQLGNNWRVGGKRMLFYAYFANSLEEAEASDFDNDIYIFDDQYNFIDSAKIDKSVIPYKWSSYSFATTNKYMLIRCQDQFFPDRSKQQIAVMVIDTSGRVVSTIDLGQIGAVDITGADLSNEDAILLSVYQRDEKRIQFYKIIPGSNEATLLSDKKVEATKRLKFLDMYTTMDYIVLSTIIYEHDITVGMDIILSYSDVDSTNSVEEVMLEKDFSLNPNPSFDYITINIEGSGDYGKMYHVYDVNGVCVMKGKVSHEQIDISNLLEGVYVLHLDGYSRTKKFLKK